METPAELVSAGRNPSRQSELVGRIAEWRMIGGYDDITPLSYNFIRASARDPDPAASLALAELAVVAAPLNPAANARVFEAAINQRDFGRAVRAVMEGFDSVRKNPWYKEIGRVRVMIALTIAGLAASIALLISGISGALRPALHDLADLFPKGMRAKAPLGAAFFALAVLFFGLGGVFFLLVLLALVAMIYHGVAYRIALAASLILALALFPALGDMEKLTGPQSEKAWTLYRVWKGDSGSDLDARLTALFGEGDSRALISRAMLARRGGDHDRAASLLARASRNPEADQAFILAQQGGVEFTAGRADGAAAHFTRLTEERPESWRGWYGLSVVRLALLDFTGAEEARLRAEELAPGELARIQAMASLAGGSTYPAFENIPEEWITRELKALAPPAKGWSAGLWSALGVTIPAVTPYYLMGLAALGLILPSLAGKRRFATICVSCGEVKCRRCHRSARDNDLCEGCNALGRLSDLDAEARRDKRDQVINWNFRKKSELRIGYVALPGFNGFVHTGSAVALFAGVLWALVLGALISETFVAPALGVWFGSGPRLAALGLLIFIHLSGALVARKS